MEQIILLNAIAVFEKQFHCSLCLHDFTGRLAAGILPSYHLNPFCTKVKRGRRKTELRCVAFDCGVVQEQLIRRPAFFLKQCACDFIEGVFPVMTGEKLWLYFCRTLCRGEGTESGRTAAEGKNPRSFCGKSAKLAAFPARISGIR